MSDFFHMGGYASYVWSSYAIGLGAMFAMLVVSVSSHIKMKKKLQGRFIRQEQHENTL